MTDLTLHPPIGVLLRVFSEDEEFLVSSEERQILYTTHGRTEDPTKIYLITFVFPDRMSSPS